MADIIDQANEVAELHLQTSLAKHRTIQTLSASAFYCIECDEVIPHQRRSAVAGVKTCIECQCVIEKKKKQGGY